LLNNLFFNLIWCTISDNTGRIDISKKGILFSAQLINDNLVKSRNKKAPIPLRGAIFKKFA